MPWAKEAPGELLDNPPQIETHVLREADGWIGIEAPENTRELAGVDPEILGRIQAGLRPHVERVFTYDLKWVGCQFPTPALAAGIEQARPGNHLSDIGHAVQKTTEGAGFSVVRSLVGHGVGRSMHEEPQIPNFGEPGRGPQLSPGMTFAIEPMINAGGADVVIHDDEWSISTSDGSLSAHFEHTVAVTEDEPRILTLARTAVTP